MRAVRVIREAEPASLGSIRKNLRGDLSTIVAKALEKERHRRYQSANELAEDLRRYLRHDPLVAQPTSAIYRARKFARRNKALVGGMAATMIALAIGLGLALVQARRAFAARDDAQAVVAFLEEALARANLDTGGPNVMVRELLDQSAAKVGQGFAGKPLVEARLRAVIGVSYQSLGLYDKAELHSQAAFEIYRRELGMRDRRTLKTMNDLAPVGFWKRDFEVAVPRAREALRLSRRALGEDDELTFYAMENLAALLAESGELAEAEPLALELLAISRRTHGEAHNTTLDMKNHLARLRVAQGRLDDAIVLLREVLDVGRRTLGEEYQKTLAYQLNLADALKDRGELAEAETYYRRTLTSGLRVWGDAHLKTLRTMKGLAEIRSRQGDHAAAEELLGDAVSVAEREKPGDFWLTPDLREAWGRSLTALGRHDEAEVQLLACYESLGTAANESATLRGRVIGALAALYEATGEIEKAGKYRAELASGNDTVEFTGR